jgi:hypothetical protein
VVSPALLVRLDALIGLLALLVVLVGAVVLAGAWLVSPALAAIGGLVLALLVVLGVYSYLHGLRSYAEAAAGVGSDAGRGSRSDETGTRTR